MTDDQASVSPLFEQARASNLVQEWETSFPFEPYLKAVNEDALNLIEQTADDVRSRWVVGRDRKPSHQNQEKFWQCCVSILTNLLCAKSDTSWATVGLYRRKGALDLQKRYRPKHMTTGRLINAQNCLMDAGLMERRKKGFNFPGFSQTGRYGLTAVGAKLLQAESWRPSDFVTGQGESIQLKNDKGSLTQYKDTPETIAMRRRLVEINSQLNSSKIGTLRPLTYFECRDGYRPWAVSLHRVFNRGAFDFGGRFVGGWWQNIRKGARRIIMIDGQPTIEADFTGFNPAALLAEIGQTIPEDPYGLIEGVSGSPELRKHAKVTLAALLNSKTGRTDEPKDFDVRKWKMGPEEFRERVRNAFPMVRSMKGNNVGMVLQRKESDVAEAVMLHFVRQGHTILPIHDAFIVQTHLQEELVKVMKAAFRDTFGQEPNLKVIPHQSQL